MRSGSLLLTYPLLLIALFQLNDIVRAQVSPEEHARHHPPGGGGLSADVKGATRGSVGTTAGPMNAMMGENGDAPTSELYPLMISGEPMPPERRSRREQLASERVADGLARFSSAVDSFEQATLEGNRPAMSAALAEMRAGLIQMEEGVAARATSVDAEAARAQALTWFKRELNLTPPPSVERGPWGVSWLHFFAMVLLLATAAAMLWVYGRAVRRTSNLLLELTGASPSNDLRRTKATEAMPINAASAIDGLAISSNGFVAKRWAGKLRVARIFTETPDVKTFRLMNPLGGPLPFDYLPGQFLTLVLEIGGQHVKRAYTLASSPTRNEYAELTVKHEDGGLVSGHLFERVQEGDLLDCSGPQGALTFTGRECKCILLIGGGVGITPLMSVLRYLTDRSWQGDIYLLYGVHSPKDIIFREELTYLANRHPNLRVTITVSHPEGSDWTGTTGRITKELVANKVPDIVSRYVHLCGPVPFMESLKIALAELGVPAKQIKTEAFGPVLGRPIPADTPDVWRPDDDPAVKAVRQSLPKVSFVRTGRSAPLPPDRTVLEVADTIGVDIDNSCRVGTCGVCRVKLLSGEVTMDVEDGLSAGDKQQGFVLACQAKAVGDISVEA